MPPIPLWVQFSIGIDMGMKISISMRFHGGVHAIWIYFGFGLISIEYDTTRMPIDKWCIPPHPEIKWKRYTRHIVGCIVGGGYVVVAVMYTAVATTIISHLGWLTIGYQLIRHGHIPFEGNIRLLVFMVVICIVFICISIIMIIVISMCVVDVLIVCLLPVPGSWPAAGSICIEWMNRMQSL